jgi:cilia- and flagella-associated protein 52
MPILELLGWGRSMHGSASDNVVYWSNEFVQVTGSGAVKMLASMKDHKAAVNAIVVSPRTGAEAVSASSDGCCIIWDLATMKRRSSFYSNTFFNSVSYHPDESQVLPSTLSIQENTSVGSLGIRTYA